MFAVYFSLCFSFSSRRGFKWGKGKSADLWVCEQAQRCVNCTSWQDGREEQTN